jgi:hypothetical protein
MHICNTSYCGEADSPRDGHPDISVTEVATCNDVRRRWFFQRPNEEYRDLMEGIEEAPLALWATSPADDGTEHWVEVFNWLPFRRATSCVIRLLYYEEQRDDGCDI